MSQRRWTSRWNGLQRAAAKYFVILTYLAHISHCKKGELSDDAILDTVRRLVDNSSELKR